MKSREKKKRALSPILSTGEQLAAWYRTELGRTLGRQEREVIRQALSSVPGVRIVQVGSLADQLAIPVERKVTHSIIDPYGMGSLDATLVAHGEALPFQNESVDIVLILHALEFVENPQQLLYEAERILSQDGYLLVLGFNPYSLWGLERLVHFRFGRAPWKGRYLSVWRLHDWFKVLGLDLTFEHRFFYRPPIARRRLLRKMNFTEKFGQRYLKPFSGVYVMMARKRVIPLSLLRARWRQRRKLVPGEVVSSSQRESKNG